MARCPSEDLRIRVVDAVERGAGRRPTNVVHLHNAAVAAHGASSPERMASRIRRAMEHAALALLPFRRQEAAPACKR